MTEGRPFQETVCPFLLRALIIGKREKKEAPFLKSRRHLNVDVPDLEKLKELSRCLGKECQMYGVNFRGCGLRRQ